MDDQFDWASLEAETFGTEASEPASPASEPELSLQSETSTPTDTHEETASETLEAAAVDPDAPTDAEAVDPVTHERITELEQKLAEFEAEKKRFAAEAEAKVRAYQEQQRVMAEQADAEEAAAFVQQLRDQGDAELAEAYEQRRNWLVQTRQEALVTADAHLKGLEALTMVLEDHLTEDQIKAIVQDAYQIAPMPTNQKQQWLASRRQSQVQATERELTLMRQVQELQNRLGAETRPIAADVVEGGRSGGGTGLAQRLEEATDFGQFADTFFGSAA